MTVTQDSESRAASEETQSRLALLMLIDGHALIHRAYHAVPPLTTSSGELINAVFGFSSMLLKALEMMRPTHVIMAMDRPVPTFRHEAYAEYKATRAKTPAPLTAQFERVRQVAQAFNIPLYEQDGFEADDVLGTLSLQSEAQGVRTTIVTGDLDTLQLVSEDVRVLTARRGIADTTVYDLSAVRARYGLEPFQLPDLKGMVGDTSDNIPGVPGIGQKTAAKLLAEYESLEGIYENLEALSARIREALAANREQVFQSRELGRIVRDAPVTLDLEPSAVTQVGRAAVIDLFRELEFRTLIERFQLLMPAGDAPSRTPTGSRGKPEQLSIFGSESAGRSPEDEALTNDAVQISGKSLEADLHVIRAPEELQGVMAQIANSRELALTCITDGPDPLRSSLLGLSLSVAAEEGWYIPFRHRGGDQLPIRTVIDSLRPALEDDRIAKVGHNLKHDIRILWTLGIDLRGVGFDTMIAAYLVNPSARAFSLNALAMATLGVEIPPLSELLGKGRSLVSLSQISAEHAAPFVGLNATVALQLRERLRSQLEERDLLDLFTSMEMPLVGVLSAMEHTGIAVDTQVLAEMSVEMTEVIRQLEERIYHAAGHPFNVGSTNQLGELLFQQLKLPQGRRTKTGYSTDNEVLESLKGKHPIIADILEYRQLIKLKNTYIDALPSLVNPDTGKLHTDFNQTVAATGRLSSSNPNLQNIPVRGDLGRKIRRAFVPTSQDNLILSVDYSQIELRVLASMSGDARLKASFMAGEDIHRATAAAVFGVPLEQVTDDQRRIAKVVNFGIVYGIGEVRLAQQTAISRAEAKEFIANYNVTYSGVKEFMDNTKKYAAFYGYVCTLLNRRRYVPDIHSRHPGVRSAAERAAINMPIQGTAADIIKIAMIRLQDLLRESQRKTRMVLQVHDELVFDVPRTELAEVAEMVKNTMEHAVDLAVPVEVDMKYGPDWYDMTPLGTTES